MALDLRPGLDPRRLVRLMREAIGRCELDLSGLTVLTEAASGAYVVTPVIAALAGAQVCAVASGNAYAGAEEIQQLTRTLARLAGVADRVEMVPHKESALVGAADIVTNSGAVRPIDAETVSWMKPRPSCRSCTRAGSSASPTSTLRRAAPGASPSRGPMNVTLPSTCSPSSGRWQCSSCTRPGSRFGAAVSSCCATTISGPSSHTTSKPRER